MKLTIRFLLFSLVAILLLYAVAESVNYHEGLRRFERSSLRSGESALQMLLRIKKEHLKLLAMMIADDQEVIEAYRQNRPELIEEHLGRFWESAYHNRLLYEIHFFKPPAVNFFNFSNDDATPRNLREVRTDMLWVSSSFKPSEHIMVCRAYAGVRATYPITLTDGTLLGGISLGTKLEWLPSYLSQILDKPSFLAYRVDALRYLTPTAYRNYLQKGRLEKEWLLGAKTRKIPEDIGGEVDFSRASQYLDINGTRYLLTLHEMRGFRGETVGKVGILHSLDLFYRDYFDMVVRHLLVVTGVLVLFILLTAGSMRRLHRRIGKILYLSRKFQGGEYGVFASFEPDGRGDEVATIHNDLLELGHRLEAYDRQSKRMLAIREEALREAERKLEEQVFIDSELDMPNRVALERELVEGEEGWHLALFDIYRFKMINDSYGIEVGNRILSKMASMLREWVARSSMRMKLFRSGADEFVLLAPGSVSKAAFVDTIRQVVASLENAPFFFEDIGISLSVEIHAGIASGRKFLLEKADFAVHEAQERRVDYFVYQEDSTDYEVQRHNIEMLKRVRLAVQADRIDPYYQPIVDAEGKRVKYEALARMREEDGRVVTPGEFLEVLQSSKLYPVLTRMMIEKSFECFRRMEEGLSINLSIIDLLNPDTVRLVEERLRAFPDPGRITFELLESESMEGYTEVDAFVQMVRKIGGKIAIDDFGTGYSNFSYLATMRPDYLKIDGSLIRRLVEDESARQIVRTIVEFAHAMEIETVAEFVSDASVFEAAKSLGVGYFQGYYFGEPVPDP